MFTAGFNVAAEHGRGSQRRVAAGHGRHRAHLHPPHGEVHRHRGHLLRAVLGSPHPLQLRRSTRSRRGQRDRTAGNTLAPFCQSDSAGDGVPHLEEFHSMLIRTRAGITNNRAAALFESSTGTRAGPSPSWNPSRRGDTPPASRRARVRCERPLAESQLGGVRFLRERRSRARGRLRSARGISALLCAEIPAKSPGSESSDRWSPQCARFSVGSPFRIRLTTNS